MNMGKSPSHGRVRCYYQRQSSGPSCPRTAAFIVYDSVLEQERLLKPVADDAGQVADKGYPRNLLHVPTEGNLLQTHDHYAGCGADDEH